MDKRREVLEKCCEEYMMKDDGTIDRALTALDKLEKEKMLEIVPDLAIDAIEGNIITMDSEQINQAKAEIRRKVRGL